MLKLFDAGMWRSRLYFRRHRESWRYAMRVAFCAGMLVFIVPLLADLLGKGLDLEAAADFQNTGVSPYLARLKIDKLKIDLT